jgi:hypothetical protein
MTRISLDDLRLECKRLTTEARAMLASIPATVTTNQPHAGAWSIAQHLDHLGMVNEQFVEALRAAINGAPLAPDENRNLRPNVLGRWFLRMLEPPPRPRVKAPAGAQPDWTVKGSEACDRFADSVEAVTRLIEDARRFDVNRVRFRHPFLPAIPFNVAAGLLMTAAHARRHLWLARRARAELLERFPAVDTHEPMRENRRQPGPFSLSESRSN